MQREPGVCVGAGAEFARHAQAKAKEFTSNTVLSRAARGSTARPLAAGQGRRKRPHMHGGCGSCNDGVVGRGCQWMQAGGRGDERQTTAEAEMRERDKDDGRARSCLRRRLARSGLARRDGGSRPPPWPRPHTRPLTGGRPGFLTDRRPLLPHGRRARERTRESESESMYTCMCARPHQPHCARDHAVPELCAGARASHCYNPLPPVMPS